jgi:prepilin-type N-terminal cleavage/methylation domain-containing protein
MRRQHGFTLIELLVAMFILLTGIVAAVGVFASSKDATVVSQRHEVAVHQAQREMEQLRALSYSEIGLDSTPATSTDPKNPGNRVLSGGQFRVKTNPAPCGGGGQPPCNLDEDLDVDTSNGEVKTGPEDFTVGTGGAAVTGKMYRYVTWRDENCPPTICDGTHNTKRVIIAVTVDPIRNLGPSNPIWLTSIVTDPNASVGGQSSAPPSANPTSVQNFYLYDKRCSDTDSQNSYTAPSAPDNNGDGRPDYDHDTYDTAAASTSCENVTASKRPNLMGPALPTYSPSPLPPYRYSADLTGDYPAGLAMLKNTSSCPVSNYTTGDAQGKYKVHAWATRAFTSDVSLTGRAYLAIWTTSVGSLPGAGRFCTTLVDRKVTAGVANDVAIGSASRTYSPWPTTKNEPGKSCGTPDFPCARLLTFEFDLSGTVVRTGGRLMMFFSVLDTSDKDLVLLYDDPRYRSFLEIETTTPCNSTGAPCPTS